MDSLKNSDSIKAINQYISYVKSKGGDATRHKASVLTRGEGDFHMQNVLDKYMYTVNIP